MSWLHTTLVLAMLTPLHASAVETTWQMCAQAGTLAEQRFGIPDGLLRAVGLVESGRTGPDGVTAAWPWTIDAGGQGHFLGDRAEAVATVRALYDAGTTSIDVGCYQVNLFHHPTAFASLDEAFDPTANALYAARFLSELHAREGSWEAAVAMYHSAVSTHGLPYRDRVFAAWGNAVPARPALVAYGMRVVIPVAAGTAPGVIVLRPIEGLPVMVRGRS